MNFIFVSSVTFPSYLGDKCKSLVVLYEDSNDSLRCMLFVV